MAGRYNEGKALDAVIRWMEVREGLLRSDDGHSPDDLNDPDETRRVEHVVTIGQRLIALEHTGIEPFANHIKMSVDNEALFAPVLERFGNRSDEELWELHVPVDASVGLARKNVPKVQKALTAWIEANAAGVPVAWCGDRFTNQVLGEIVAEVPFRFSLHRAAFPGHTQLGGKIILRPHVETDLDEARQRRLRDACDKKFSKLAAWKHGDGAHTVLVLEENDISLTNHHRVTGALVEVEAGMSDIPDEVFLVTTIFPKWQVRGLRRGGTNYHDDDERFHEVDPATLTRLTKG